jgi:hypothetical protein
VAIIRNTDWIAGDVARDGAGEFAIFLRVAELQRAHRAAGVVAVGDRSGILRSGGERALRHVTLAGIPVVKLAPDGEVLVVRDILFLNGGTLNPTLAATTLTRCLELHGSPPAAENPERPTPIELAAIRIHLRPFQAALDLAATQRIAQR